MPPSICRCGWRRPTAMRRATPGLINAVLRRLARDGKARLAALDPVPLDTPEWLMRRWIAHYGEETARAIALAHTPRAVARSHGQERPAGMGQRRSTAARCRPARCAPSRRVRSRSLRASKRRLVGAGRRRGIAGAAARRRARQDRSPISAPRPAARPRNWRRPARRSPRSTARARGSPACGKT